MTPPSGAAALEGVATPDAPPDVPALDDGRGTTSPLFGRGLLYVAVWALQLLCALAVSPVLAHLLPPSQFGQLAAAIALHQVLVVLAVLGLDQVVVLLRAEHGSERPARSLVALGVGLAGALALIAAVTSPLWSRELGFDGPSRLLVITIAWTPAAAGLQLIGVLLTAQDRLRAFSTITLLSAVGGQLVGMGILLATGSRLASTYAIGNLVTMTAALVVGAALVRPRWRQVVREGRLVRRALRLGVPLMIGGLSVYVLNAGDRLVIQRLLGSAEAGRYQIAYTVGNVVILLLSSITTVWAARIAGIRDRTERWAVIAAARDGLMRLMAPVVLGLALGAPLLLLVVAPSSYATDALLPVVLLVALAGFPVLSATATGRALVTLEATRPLALAAIIAAVVNIALNLLLDPVWGLVGAATATVVAFTAQAAAERIALARYGSLPPMRPATFLPAVAAVTVAGATLLVPSSVDWDVARAVAAVACVPWLVLELRALRGVGGAPAAAARPTAPLAGPRPVRS